MPSMFAARMTSFAPLTGSDANNLVESGRPIYVHGILFATASADNTVSMRDGAGTLISTMTVSAVSSPLIHDIPFLADKGLMFRVTTGSPAVNIIVFYSNPGA